MIDLVLAAVIHFTPADNNVWQYADGSLCVGATSDPTLLPGDDEANCESLGGRYIPAPSACTAVHPCYNGHVPSYNDPDCWPGAIYCPPCSTLAGTCPDDDDTYWGIRDGIESVKRGHKK